MVQTLARAIVVKDSFTSTMRQSGKYAKAIAKKNESSVYNSRHVEYAALMHDMAK
jgi:hypothetical protein